MGRPPNRLIDRDEAISKALELIDRIGIDAVTIRKLGDELGVHGASLYYHFRDKGEILEGVQRLILRSSRVLPKAKPDTTWREDITGAVVRYRSALVTHPNAAPIMWPGLVRPLQLKAHDNMIVKMLAEGVPTRYCWAIIDSVETLAFGSALKNPQQLSTSQRVQPRNSVDLPNVETAIRDAPASPLKMFRLQLDVTLDGWTALIASEPM